ncbi:hypothetical protein VB735_10270 [Halotia wernerae UHCC 0503]|nr:hypothetical protein [Halotia wernerae UHCC 0503]
MSNPARPEPQRGTLAPKHYFASLEKWTGEQQSAGFELRQRTLDF